MTTIEDGGTLGPQVKCGGWLALVCLVSLLHGCDVGSPSASQSTEPTDTSPEVLTAFQQDSSEQKSAAAVPASDWLFFRGDFAGRAFVPGAKLPEKLDVIWEYWQPKCSYESSPVVSEGQVVVADLDGMVRCLNLADKKLLWQTPTKFGFTASPSIRNRKIYIGDNDGMFRCLDMKDGTIDWEFQANAQIDSSANFFDNQVIFGSQDANVYGLNMADGTLQWKHTIDDQVRCSIVIEGNRTAVAGCDAMLHVIDASNGNGLAKIELSSQTAVAPTMFGPLAYFGMESGEFVCANMEAKKIVWTWKDERQDAAIRGSAAVTETAVIFGNRGSRVVCLDRHTGELKWSYRSKRGIDASVLVVGDRVYIGDIAGNFMVLNLDDGQLLQTIELSGGITSAPCLTGDRLLLTTQEGIVYCLGSKPK
ncbi:MAG: PQQ-binding-like beta-propeller repeat protein [Pirellulaceae bacterium]|nr:PQQ-binding-like beta-propeller repeat protein [Pirellulaceae bacterium]